MHQFPNKEFYSWDRTQFPDLVPAIPRVRAQSIGTDGVIHRGSKSGLMIWRSPNPNRITQMIHRKTFERIPVEIDAKYQIKKGFIEAIQAKEVREMKIREIKIHINESGFLINRKIKQARVLQPIHTRRMGGID